MTRASYASAVAWIAANDDCEWVEHHPDSGPGSISVTGAMACDLFGVDTTRLRTDLTIELIRTRVRSKHDGALPGRVPSEPVYRGEFYHDGRWQTVENRNGDKIAYMTEAYALAGAKFVLGQRFEESQKCPVA